LLLRDRVLLPLDERVVLLEAEVREEALLWLFARAPFRLAFL
jgi:hypothetical protein